MYPGTTTRTGPPWARGSGSEFICHASSTSCDIALLSGDGTAVGLNGPSLFGDIRSFEGNMQPVV